MQEQKFEELENRASSVGELDAVRQHEARSRVHQVIETMKAEGKALELTAEEEEMLWSFRRFKLRMRKDGETFTWQTRRPKSRGAGVPRPKTSSRKRPPQPPRCSPSSSRSSAAS